MSNQSRFWLTLVGICSLLILVAANTDLERARLQPNRGLSREITRLGATVEGSPTATASVGEGIVRAVVEQKQEPSTIWGLLSDLAPNLIAEAIGIIFTVGIIDQLIKRREQQKWKPAKGLLLAHSLELVDRLLFWLLPSHFRMPSPMTYYFANTPADTTFTYLEDKELSEIPAIVRDEAEARSELTSTVVDDTRRQLDYILRFSSFIMEARLFDLLLKLDNSLDDLELVDLDLEPSISEEERRDFANLTLQVITTGLELRSWLVDQADTTGKPS